MIETIGQPELLKEINRLRAFEILKAGHVVSRPDLARDAIAVGYRAYLSAEKGARVDLLPWLAA